MMNRSHIVSAQQRSKATPRRNRSAFTLVELLVVVAILGIASLMIVPALGTSDDLRIAAAARILLSDMQYAQNRAIALQKNHYIEFNDNSYSIYTRDASTSPPYQINNPVTNDPYTTTFGAGGPGNFANVTIGTFNFGSGSTSLCFDDLGTPWGYDPVGDNATQLTTAATVTLQMANGSFPLVVTIQPYTGEASAQ
jgi:prepilin-type N-terminal cleavage/methylation domain-containing protein